MKNNDEQHEEPQGPILPGWRPRREAQETAEADEQTDGQTASEKPDERVRPYIPVDIANQIRRCFPGQDVAEVSVKLLRYALLSGLAFHPSFQDLHASQHALANSLDSLTLGTLELSRQLSNLTGASELTTMMTAMSNSKVNDPKVNPPKRILPT